MEEGASTQPATASSSATNDAQATTNTSDLPVASADATTTDNAAAPTADVTDTDDTTEPLQPIMCGICNEQPGKYKCTRCKLPLYVSCLYGHDVFIISSAVSGYAKYAGGRRRRGKGRDHV
jgi:hypothetical protein